MECFILDLDGVNITRASSLPGGAVVQVIGKDFLTFFLCYIVAQTIHVFALHESLRTSKLTQEGIERNPGSRNCAIKKAVQVPHHQRN